MRRPFEQFPALSAIGICRHTFTQRIPGIDLAPAGYDKAEILKKLSAAHAEIRRAVGMGDWVLATAQQVHGNKIAVFDSGVRSDSHVGCEEREFPACDGLVTNQKGVSLGIFVADCCAVYLVDPKKPAIGLVHSGKKGTEVGVVPNAIRKMIDQFGSDPANMIVQLSPCIRPPHYEIDFAADIVRQCHALGVKEIHDSGICTACDLNRYYSYRAEKGKTGRMLALLGINPTSAS